MKKYLFILIFSASNILCFSQTNFCAGFKDGYIAGYKDGNKLALDPIPPLCPLCNTNESQSSYQDGYNRGFKVGLQNKPNNSYGNSNSSTTSPLSPLAIEFGWQQAIDDLRKQEALNLQAKQIQLQKEQINAQNQQNKEIIERQEKEENQKRLQNKIEQLRSWYKDSYESAPTNISGGWHKVTVTDGFDFATPMYALVENNQITKLYNKPKLYNLKTTNLIKGKVMSQLNDDTFCEFYITDWNRDDYSKVPNELQNALDITPKTAIDYYNRGLLLDLTFINAGDGDRSLCIKEFSKAIELNNSYFDAYFKKAELEFQCGYGKTAIDDYKKASELKPQNKECYYRIGDLYFYSFKDFEMAIKNINKAIEIDPKYSEAYQLRGSAKAYFNDLQGAIEDYTKVLEIDRENSSAYYNRAVEKFKLKDNTGACEDWNSASKLGHKGAENSFKKNCATE